MSISRSDVEYVARLAHLNPDDETLERLTRDLGAILDYVARLAEAEGTLAGTDPSETGNATPLREDVVRPGLPPGTATRAAPGAGGDLFRVPPAFGVDPQPE